MVTLRAWPAIVVVIAIVLVCGWPESICAWLGQTMPPELILNVALPSEVSGVVIEPSEPNRKVSLPVVPLSWCVVVTWLPPATGTTAVILSVAVPVDSPTAVTLYTQVFPTATGNSAVPAKGPPAEVLAVALPPAGDDTDEETADVDEPDEQPARASAAAASSVAQPADMRELERWRFMAQPFRGTSVGMVRRGGRVAGDSRGA